MNKLLEYMNLHLISLMQDAEQVEDEMEKRQKPKLVQIATAMKGFSMQAVNACATCSAR